MRFFTGRKAGITRAALAVIVIVVIVLAGTGIYFVATTTTTRTTTATITSTIATTTTTTAIATTTTTSTTTSAAPHVINIGILEPFTGSSSSYGEDVSSGVNLAVSQINAQGGVTVNGSKWLLKVYEADEGSGGTQTVNALDQLVLQDHVVGFVGTDFSGDTETILPEIAEYHPLMFTTSNSLDSLFSLVGTNYTSYGTMFRVTATDSELADGGFSGFVLPSHTTSIAIVYEDYLFAHEVNNETLKLAAQNNVAVLADIVTPGSETDFSAVIASIAAVKPQAIIECYSGSDAETFIEQARVNPVLANTPIVDVSLSDLSNPAIDASLIKSGVNLNYAFEEDTFYFAIATNKTTAFVNAFEAANGGKPPNMVNSAYAYDVVYMLTNAITATGSLNSFTLANYIAKMTYVGASGIYRFNPTHEIYINVPNGLYDDMTEFYNGHLTAIWPPSQANGTMILPPGY